MDFDIKGVKGLESFDDSQSNPFIYIVNSTKQISKIKELNPAAKVALGDAYNSKTGEILAKQGEPLSLVLVKYYKVWNVWNSERQLVKYTFDINGQAWSDGSPILPEDRLWHVNEKGKKQPYAVETITFVVVTKEELMKPEPAFMMLSFGLTNKSVKEFVGRLNKLLKEAVKNHVPEYLHEIAFELTSDMSQPNADGETWYGWATMRCTHKIKPESSQKLIPIYVENKDLDKEVFRVNPALLMAAQQSQTQQVQPASMMQSIVAPSTMANTMANVTVNANPAF